MQLVFAKGVPGRFEMEDEGKERGSSIEFLQRSKCRCEIIGTTQRRLSIANPDSFCEKNNMKRIISRSNVVVVAVPALTSYGARVWTFWGKGGSALFVICDPRSCEISTQQTCIGFDISFDSVTSRE